MPQNLKADTGRDESASFQPSDHMEQLIALRESDHHTYLLRTSEQTRNAVAWYEVAKRKAENSMPKVDGD